ncbi:MAG: hypothetical protein WC868_05915 [Bacteroidales bacterium]
MIEKEKALRITKNLIEFKESVLDTKYLKSHEKVAVIHKEHVIELIGGENRSLKYLGLDIPLSKSEYKEVYDLFINEIKKRKVNSASEKFHELENFFDKN